MSNLTRYSIRQNLIGVEAASAADGEWVRHKDAADLLEANAAEIERLTDAYNCWESDFNDLLESKRWFEAENEKLRAALFGNNGALKRMDIARGVLTENGGEWNVLNTDDIRKSLAAVEQSEAGSCYDTPYENAEREASAQSKGSPDARITRR